MLTLAATNGADLLLNLGTLAALVAVGYAASVLTDPDVTEQRHRNRAARQRRRERRALGMALLEERRPR